MFELIDELDILQGTAYDYIQSLETVGLVEGVREQRSREYDAESIVLTLSTDGETQTIIPALIATVTRRDQDEDIDIYVERRGLGGPAVALEYVSGYAGDTVNHRITSWEPGLSPLEAKIILQALKLTATEYADSDA